MESSTNINKNTEKKPRLKLKQKKFIELYIRKLGNISAVCKELKIDRTTYYLWLKNNQLFKDKINEAIETHNDAVESIILNLAINQDKDMLKFWAKTKMKNRGFTEKTEIEHTGKIDNKLEVVIVDATQSNSTNETTPE